MVGGLVEDQHVRAGGHQDASDSRRRSPPESPRAASRRPRPRTGSCPSRARALPGVRPVARWAASSAVPGRAELLGVLGEVAELHVVAAAQPAAVERRGGRRAPRSASSCRRRWARRATRARRARARARRPRAGCVPGTVEPGVLELEHDAAGALGRAEAEAERARVARVALDPLRMLARAPSRATGPGAPWSPCSGSARRSAPCARSRACCLSIALPSCELARRASPGARRARGRGRSAPGRPRARAPRCRPPRGTSGRGRRG